MSDLSKLAENYHDGGLQRTLELIGKNQQRKYIKSIANGELKNKQVV